MGPRVRPYLLYLLADAHARGGRIQEAQDAVIEALALVQTYGERWWEAELHRTMGVLLLELSPENGKDAEASFERALQLAGDQGARSVELRAATSLARLWRERGTSREAQDLLAPLYNWFTEGFDTPDLKEAKALLDELS